MHTSITTEVLKSLQDSISDNGSLTAIQRAVTKNGIINASENYASSATNTTVYSNEIPENKITDQEDSGRCWLFATLNILQHDIAKKHKLEGFELSQSYSFFWDKLEKSNLFYEQVIDNAELPLDDRLMEFLLNAPQFDGGWWEMSSAIIKKYGVVPKQMMPEAFATSNTRQLNSLLNKKLRKDALLLREAAHTKTDEEIDALRQDLLKEVYRMLIIAIGTPPQTFDFTYKDKDKKYHRQDNLTPLEFLKKYVSLSFDDYISIVNDPSPGRSYLQTYEIDGTANIVGEAGLTFLNVSVESFKELATKQVLAGEPIWFGCDIGSSTTKKGYMSLDAFDFNNTFGVDLNISKADRLQTRDTSMNHAVVIAGVDIVNDAPVQWKVENSWGDEVGMKGYYSMSTEWLEHNGYAIVIRKDLLSEDQKAALKKKPILLPRWDPLYNPAN